MEYWSDLYLELSKKITDNLTEIQWCDLWHEQISYLTSELPFPTPAVFIAFNMLNVEDKGMKGQICNTQIDFYLYYETFSDTYSGSVNQTSALDFLKQLTEIHKLFHATSGDNYSGMSRIDMKREDSGDAGNLYRISFTCIVDDMSATKQFNENVVSEVTLIRENIPVPVVVEPLFTVEL